MNHVKGSNFFVPLITSTKVDFLTSTINFQMTAVLLTCCVFCTDVEYKVEVKAVTVEGERHESSVYFFTLKKGEFR